MIEFGASKINAGKKAGVTGKVKEFEMARPNEKPRENRGRFLKYSIIAQIFAANCLLALPAQANGFGENRAWQFKTSSDRANQAIVTDMIERKKGGYYDGFTTVVNITNNTTIGTQLNCNNVANALGNEAQNGQSGSASNLTSGADITSDATGNVATDRADAWTAGVTTGSGTTSGTTTQDNSGAVTSGVDGSDVSSATGGVNNGSTTNDILNNQDNSGSQSAGITSSEACNMAGSSFSGSVQGSWDSSLSTTGPLN